MIAYATAAGSRQAVVDVDLRIPAGQFAAIVGPSGCGKSTILNSVSGLRAPTEGRIYLDGVGVSGINHDVGYLFQRDALLPWRTVLENVCLPLLFRKVSKSEAQHRARSWLAKVGLEGFENDYPHQLSGGMRKRAALATVFVYEPKVLLMDEPFSALDVQTRTLMENGLLDIWSEGLSTVIFVTHDLEEAIGLADRVIVFTVGPGRVKSDYPIDMARPRSLTEIRFTPEFQHIYQSIWTDLRDEVLAAYEQAGRRRDARLSPRGGESV
jgi:NitT/TauT family transport system ATP-binding protein